jgi:DNA ligase-associated metallophosphoesterase
MTEAALRQQPAHAAFSLAGEMALADRRGALFFPRLGMLVVADLHLEKGSAYARRGQLLPPYDTAATLASLAAVIADHAPSMVVSLGDSFHDCGGPRRLPALFRSTLLSLMAGRDWFWVAGNHDPQVPEGLPGTFVDELAVGPLILRHAPGPGPSRGEIAGHLHPCARIVHRGRSVRRRCFATDGERLVMPAFGAYAGSMNILDRAYAGLFRKEALMAYMVGLERVFAIAGKLLRPG